MRYRQSLRKRACPTELYSAEIEHQVCGNRVDFYLGHLAYCHTYVPKRVEYVVADSFYNKRKGVDGVVNLGWNVIGKLRQDANLKYLYQKPSRSDPGRQKTYDGKVARLKRQLKYLALLNTSMNSSFRNGYKPSRVSFVTSSEKFIHTPESATPILNFRIICN